jgi:soluble lytic murein transglycosylase-like protein
LSLCFPWNGAYATEAELSSTNELTEYIKLVEKDNSIPRGLLLAIAKTESNVNPYAINVNGKAVVASSMQEAVLVAKRALARGITNVDIGVMQVNYRWHKERFRSIEKMLDPKINIQYAGNLLLSLFRQHGTWYKAISYYHSANHEHHRKYSKKVVTAWVVGRKLN